MARKAVFRRRRLSLTSLIDVIFLLLLFFMLSSTFSRFSEVELVAAGAGPTAAAPETRPLFLKLRADGLRVNARDTTLQALPAALAELSGPGPGQALVSTARDVTAQRLTDLLLVLRTVEGLKIQVLTPT